MRSIILIFSIFTLLFPASASASPYIVIDGGGGGDAEAGSIGIGFGGTQAIANRHPLELQFFFAFTDDVPDDLLDYPIPHYDYTLLGDHKRQNEIGTLLKTGIGITPYFQILGGAGVSFQEVVMVSQSNVTGWYYTEDSKYETYFNWYGGVMFILSGKLVLTGGYGNRRGIVGGLGFTW